MGLATVGESRPLLALHRARLHGSPAPSRRDSCLPVTFGVLMMLFAVTTWIGTHRTISSLSVHLEHHPWMTTHTSKTGRSTTLDGGGSDSSGGGIGLLVNGGNSSSSSSSTSRDEGSHGTVDGSEQPVEATNGEIELEPDKVAAIVERARSAEAAEARERQAPAEEDEQAGLDGAGALDSAAKYKDLYNANTGSVIIGPLDGDASAACPENAPPHLHGAQAAVALLVAHSGAQSLERAVRSLLRQWGHAGDDVTGLLHLYVVVDAADDDARRAAAHFALETLGLVRVAVRGSTPRNSKGAVAANSPVGAGMFALRLLAECLRYPGVLLLPSGVRLAPDALPLFAGAQWLLASDPSLWCITGASSSSSSVARNSSSSDAHALLRTDVPPLLENGWLVSTNTASDLLKQWRTLSRKHIDAGSSLSSLRSWLATSSVGKGRQCVFPGQPRVWVSLDTTADEEFTGIHSNTTVNELLNHANNAKLDASGDNEAVVEETTKSQPPGSHLPQSWFEVDLSYLLEPTYGLNVLKRLQRAVPATPSMAAAVHAIHRPRRVEFASASDLRQAVDALGLHVDMVPLNSSRYCFRLPAIGSILGSEHCQDFMPVGAYRGVLTVRSVNGGLVYLYDKAYNTRLGDTMEGVAPLIFSENGPEDDNTNDDDPYSESDEKGLVYF